VAERGPDVMEAGKMTNNSKGFRLSEEDNGLAIEFHTASILSGGTKTSLYRCFYQRVYLYRNRRRNTIFQRRNRVDSRCLEVSAPFRLAILHVLPFYSLYLDKLSKAVESGREK
jgi:hypothetical protein